MSENNKNTGKMFSRLIRYLNRDISGKERNSFERELQRDPFAEEAIEGLSSLSSEQAEGDLNELSGRLRKRTSKKNYAIYYGIAASVAILMVISTLFIMIQRRNVSEVVAEAVPKSEPIEIQVPAAQTLPKTEIPVVAMTEKDNSGAARSESKKSEAAPEMIREINYDTLAVSDISLPVVAMADKMAAPQAELSRKKEAAKGYQLKGKLLSSEDNLPVPGASVTLKGTATGAVTDAGGNFAIGVSDNEKRTLVASFIGMESKEFVAKADTQMNITMAPSSLALNEVVVVGYGSSKKTDYSEAAEPSAYTPPRPVNGKASFDKYIEDNIRRPDTLSSGQRVVVVINFTVRADGNRDNYKIIKSPSKQFSDEALRLVKNGPSWIPAEQNGVKTDDDVRLRIVFK